MLGLFQRRAPVASHATILAARPVRNPAAKATPHGTGLRLTAPLQATAVKRWFGSPVLEKTFELDDLGAAVWNACNGRDSVEQIIRDFAAAKRVNLREAEVAVTTFLRTLLQRNLVALAVTAESPDSETPRPRPRGKRSRR